MMLSKFHKNKNQKGFTLIELLIVVAIIGILAAIAIPQFASYRQRAYNSSALSDMRNLKTAEESLYADFMAYGITGGAAAVLDAAVPAAVGVLEGPMAAAIGGAAPVAGARIAGNNDQGAASAMAFGVSNGVNVTATSTANAAGGHDNYIVAARHEQGDTAYAADSDNTTTTYRVQNPVWIGALDAISATVPASSVGADDLTGAAGGGSPTANWTLM